MNLLKRTQLPGLDTMAVMLVVWICTLPFIGFLIAPIFGVETALTVGLILLVIMLVVCWGLCIPSVIRAYRTKREKRLLQANEVIQSKR